MASPLVIVGWPSTDRVPGAVGEVKYGQGAQSAGSFPKKTLLVGLLGSTPGTLTPDTQVAQIATTSDADTYCGAGSELATMAYDALQVPGAQVWICAPAAPSGGVAATAVIDVSGGTWTTPGTWIGRFAGTKGQKSTIISVGIGSADSVTTVGNNIRDAINANAQLPYSATASTGVVTLTDKTVGVRGNQKIFFQDTSQLPSGFTSYIGGAKLAISSSTNASPIVVTTSGNHGLTTNQKVQIVGHVTNTAANGTWSITVTGATTFSLTGSTGNGVGGATGSVYGPQVPGNGALFVGGTGAETYTNLLSTILPSKYDRIALACDDATNLTAWKTQIDAQAGVTSNIRQHVGFGFIGTLTTAQSRAGTTLNDQRFQCLWHLNSETSGARIAAYFMAYRSVVEQSDPAAGQQFAGYALPTVAPQSQNGDWATHSTQNTALLNGVTPITTTGDGNARIIRSIVTHCLNGANPDYSTFDTCDAVCPDFVLDDILLYDTTVYFANNLRVADDPASTDPPAPQGVATPSLRNAAITNKLRDYEGGVGFPAPLIVNVSSNLPYSAYDAVGKRILTAVNIKVAPPNVQVGTSVRQMAS